MRGMEWRKEYVMEEKLNSLIVSVESWLKAFNERNLLEYFYVGKTEINHFEERQNQHLREGYPISLPISSTANPHLIGELEKALIDYFTEESSYKEICKNNGAGNEGNPNANMLYLSIGHHPLSIDDLHLNDVIDTTVVEL